MNTNEGTSNMIKHNPLFALLVIGNLLIGHAAFAQDKDVDQADTLDFQAFHKNKKEAIKVWDKNPAGPTKTYQDQTVENATAGKTVAPSTTSTATSKTLVGTLTGEASKNFEIRERYTLTHSVKTPYSAFYVIEPLYKQAAQLCPKGWKKLSEKSEPVEQDYYLYYEIECL